MAEDGTKPDCPPTFNVQDHSWLSRRSFLAGLAALFVALNVFLFGYRNRWWRAQEVTLDVSIPKSGRVDLEAEGLAFVKPRKLRVFGLRKDKVLRVCVEFEFKGAETPENKMSLHLDLLDKSDRLLGSGKAVCSDARIAAAKGPIQIGSEFAVVSRVNSPVIKIPVTWSPMHSVARIRLTFAKTNDASVASLVRGK